MEVKKIDETKTTEIAKVSPIKLSAGERFTTMIIKEFSSGVSDVALTEFQKRLAQNYFISIDATLKAAETKRLAKTFKQDPIPVTWENVNMESLSRNVVAMARIGLDPAQKNHINMIPYKNNATKKYDIGFIEGYRGLELKAKKYGLEVPNHVIVELVYATDKFKSIKKSGSNKIESYEFEVVNDFDRGDIIGGFYYHVYTDSPEKNKLVVMTMKDIEKRKPQYASAEFWGGEKDVWKDGKVVGKEHVEGWYPEMCLKTISRAAYGDITIDSQKIDDDYMLLKKNEMDIAEAELKQEVDENMCSESIDVSGAVEVESEPVKSSIEEEKPSFA